MSIDLFAWVILPLFIFFARIVDVSLGTLRIVFVARGRRLQSALLGFVEILIWIVVVGQVIQNLNTPIAYVAYAGGFAAGTYIGLYIEDKLAIGMLAVRIIVATDAQELLDRLSGANFGVTSVDARGATGEVKIVYTIIMRKDLPAVTRMVDEVSPKAFVSVEEVRSAREGVFPPAAGFRGLRLFARRKGK
ncbi:MAG TPA: DUF2179 domain-containing protein [Anaerolineae bacterium]|nr:DUF2179 domain-containing protein [Anaerolineae bacterium]